MIKAIIGLGNPGPQYYHTRHSIGFRVVDALADKFGASWRTRGDMEMTSIQHNGREILLIKPQTFMNASGKIIPELAKKGIKPEDMLVIHDELELPFGTIAFKTGGSAKGHNGLKSLIAACGPEFHRVRCGIGRPENREEVADYVLKPFIEDAQEVQMLIDKAVEIVLANLG